MSPGEAALIWCLHSVVVGENNEPALGFTSNPCVQSFSVGGGGETPVENIHPHKHTVVSQAVIGLLMKCMCSVFW